MWSANDVHYWRAYVPPSRPSRFDLDLCTQYASEIKTRFHRQPRVLILGSTNEFRDWAFEESCDVTVIDNSEGFHAAISDDRKYKRAQERVVFRNWEDIQFAEEFELIVGDLVIGNIAPNNVELVIGKIKNALVPGGVFISKSYFFNPNRPFKSLNDVFSAYEASQKLNDPFPLLAYDLTVAAMDDKTFFMTFNKMHELVKNAHEQGRLSDKTMERYKEFGWEGDAFAFYVMPIPEWERLLGGYFAKYTVYFGPYPWSSDFPIYVATK